MSNRRDQSSNPRNPSHPHDHRDRHDPHDPLDPGRSRSLGSDRNAFASFFLDHVARREPVPATPEVRAEGPFRVVKLYGDGPPLWACYAAGERRPRTSVEAPDLAYLLAAGMEVAERPLRFRFERADEPMGGRGFHLLHDGQPVGTADLAGDTLPLHLTGLADLRVRPLALAHYLLSVPDESLRRTGRILVEMLEARR